MKYFYSPKYPLLIILLLSWTIPSSDGMIPTDNIVAHYALNGNTNDESLNKLDGTAYNIEWVGEQIGQVASFNGFSGKIDFGDYSQKAISNPSLGSFSISYWVKLDLESVYTTKYIMCSGGHTGESTGIAMVQDPTGIGVWFRSENRAELGIYTLSYTAANWFHFVLTWDQSSSNLKIYYNSTLESNIIPTQDNGGRSDTFAKLTFGVPNHNLDTRYFTGDIDQIRIYSDILTQDEVNDLYSEPWLRISNSSPQSSSNPSLTKKDTTDYDTISSITLELSVHQLSLIVALLLPLSVYVRKESSKMKVKRIPNK